MTMAMVRFTQSPYKLVTTDIESVDNSLAFSVFAISEDDASTPYQGEINFTFIDTYNWTEATDYTKNNTTIETTFIDFGNTATVVLNKGSADPNFYFSNDGVTYTYCGSVASPINGATSPGADLIQFTARYAAFFTGGSGTTVDTSRTDTGITLIFPGAVSTNPDLKLFQSRVTVVQGVIQGLQFYDLEWSKYCCQILLIKDPPAVACWTRLI